MGAPFDEFQRLFKRALRQPPSYLEVTELTGQSMNSGDRRAGRAAWLLANIENLEVYGVHSKVWHKNGSEYSAPVLDQLARAIDHESQLTHADLQKLGKESSHLDVVGVHDRAIWVVQTVWETKRVDSSLARHQPGSGKLFRGRVFDNPKLPAPSVAALYTAYDVIRKAFPTVDVHALALVLHRSSPDFELFQIDVKRTRRPEKIRLEEDRIRKNSLDFVEKLEKDHESLWVLPHQLDDELFRGIPPCRGGRTLCMLAAMAKRQMEAPSLLIWKERDFIEMLKDDFNYEVPRDKVRHDLVDRLVGQGFMRKWASGYYLTMKGIARYLYCLAKYTTKGTADATDVLDACTAHRERIVSK